MPGGIHGVGDEVAGLESHLLAPFPGDDDRSGRGFPRVELEVVWTVVLEGVAVDALLFHPAADKLVVVEVPLAEGSQVPLLQDDAPVAGIAGLDEPVGHVRVDFIGRYFHPEIRKVEPLPVAPDIHGPLDRAAPGAGGHALPGLFRNADFRPPEDKLSARTGKHGHAGVGRIEDVEIQRRDVAGNDDVRIVRIKGGRLLGRRGLLPAARSAGG